MIAVLHRIPLGAELHRVDREVRVLEAVESDGSVIISTLRSERCESPYGLEQTAISVLCEVLENRDRCMRDVVAVVCIERIGPTTRVVKAYEVAPLRALFAMLEEFGRVFCPACRAELNPCDERCWKCGAELAHTEAA